MSKDGKGKAILAGAGLATLGVLTGGFGLAAAPAVLGAGGAAAGAAGAGGAAATGMGLGASTGAALAGGASGALPAAGLGMFGGAAPGIMPVTAGLMGGAGQSPLAASGLAPMFTEAAAAGASAPGMGMTAGGIPGGAAGLMAPGPLSSGIPAAPSLFGGGGASAGNQMAKRIAMQGMKQLAQPGQEERPPPSPQQTNRPPGEAPTHAQITGGGGAPSMGMGPMDELERERLRMLAMTGGMR